MSVTITVKAILNIHERQFVCICTGDVGVLLSVEGQLILCGQVDEGLHGGEVGDVTVTDLTEQRLQVPTHRHTETMRNLTLSECKAKKTKTTNARPNNFVPIFFFFPNSSVFHIINDMLGHQQPWKTSENCIACKREYEWNLHFHLPCKNLRRNAVFFGIRDKNRIFSACKQPVTPLFLMFVYSWLVEAL